MDPCPERVFIEEYFSSTGQPEVKYLPILWPCQVVAIDEEEAVNVAGVVVEAVAVVEVVAAAVAVVVVAVGVVVVVAVAVAVEAEVLAVVVTEDIIMVVNLFTAECKHT